MNEKRREIKVPVSRRLREFRMRFVPALIFAGAFVAAGFLWNQAVLGPTMVGAVESVQTVVKAPTAGQITNLMVRQFEIVKKDQPIAEFISADYRAMSSQVQDMRSRIAMTQLEVTAILDRDRISYHLQTMQMDTLKVKADLASSEAELPIAEAAFERAERGWKEQVVPYNDYQAALTVRDSLRAKIVELRRLVKDAEQHLADANKNAGPYKSDASMGQLSDALATLTQTRRELDVTRALPNILKAPSDGVVTEIYHRDGENVQAGDLIVTIQAIEPSRIVTYIRQGVNVPPKRGEPVTVRCRSHAREEAIAKVEDIGFRYEPITNHALMRPGVPFELGMPVSMSVPASLKSILKPGEIVDLAVGK